MGRPTETHRAQEDDRDDEKPRYQQRTGPFQDEHLEPEEKEEGGVEEFVDHAPEGVEMAGGLRAHGRAAAVAADDDAGRHHRDQARDLEPVGDRIGQHDQGEREEQFERMMVDRLERPIGEEAEAEAQRAPPPASQRKNGARSPGARRPSPQPGDREKPEEDDQADPVVEERLAGKLGLQVARGPQVLEQGDDGDRIGRRDERPEHQGR